MKLSIKIINLIGLVFMSAVSTQAQFLDYSQPARATALGGNLVALPEGPSAMVFNPAGLALQQRFEVTARYEGMFLGLENDNLSTSNVTALSASTPFGVFGGSWDHLGSNLLAQDLFRLAWGKDLKVGGIIQDIGGGVDLSFQTQRYTLLAPISGLSVNQLSPSAFSFGAGLLVSFPADFTLGISADDINQPNLGIVGVDRLPVLLRWGLAEKLFTRNPVQLTLTASQSMSNTLLNTYGGAEVSFPNFGAKIRGGMGSYQGSAGFGYELADFFLDYAYSFSIQGFSAVSNSALPPSHLLELGFQWGSLSTQAAYETFLGKAQQAEVQAQWEKSNWYYQECLSMAPEDKTSTEGRDRTLVKMNQQRAEKAYQDGQAARQQTLLVEARNDFELATKLDPNNSDYAKALAEVGADAGKMEGERDVAESIRKAAELIQRNDQKGAERVVDQALQRHPHNGALELVQSSFQEEGGSEEEPSPVKGQPQTQSADQSAKLAAMQAELLMARGQSDLAKQKLEEALKANPENVKIKMKLVYLEKPTPTVSPENAQQAQDLYDKGLQAYLEGKLEEAIKDWEDALKLDPSNTRVQNNLIRAQIEQKMEHP